MTEGLKATVVGHCIADDMLATYKHHIQGVRDICDEMYADVWEAVPTRTWANRIMGILGHGDE